MRNALYGWCFANVFISASFLEYPLPIRLPLRNMDGFDIEVVGALADIISDIAPLRIPAIFPSPIYPQSKR